MATGIEGQVQLGEDTNWTYNIAGAEQPAIGAPRPSSRARVDFLFSLFLYSYLASLLPPRVRQQKRFKA